MGGRQRLIGHLPAAQLHHTATTANLDALRLRSAAPPVVERTGALPETWAWTRLAVPLGRLDGALVRVCAGLQSPGAGATAVFVDKLALNSSRFVDSGRGGGARVGCAPSEALVRVSDLSQLSDSCGFRLEPGSLGVMLVVLAVLALALLFRLVQTLRARARDRQWNSPLAATTPAVQLSVEVSSPRPLA